MSKKYLLFDLDGTLTDPALGITNAIMHALKAFNIEVKNRQELYSFIGPPLFDSFKDFFHFSDEQADLAVAKYREYFSVKGLFENTPYPGIHDCLSQLTKDGYQLAVATSKPEPFAKQILDYFELTPYFSVICGSEMHGRKEDKADVIKKVIDYFKDPQMDHYLMIGDRKHDAIGANKNHMDCLGVTYGYGSKEELEEAKCIAIVDTLAELISKIHSL